MNLLPAVALVMIASDDAVSARLDHLLAIHRSYELPLPSPDAVLVRFTYSPGGNQRTTALAFCEPSELERLTGNSWCQSVTVVKPDPVTLGTEVDFGDLQFALQCHERGWRALARAALRKWLTVSAEQRGDRTLARLAWSHWRDYISHSSTPLSVIATHMKRALPHRGIENADDGALVRSLELAAVPRNSPPGSDDALIDELIEAGDTGPFGQSWPYRALALRGFAAVPALIAHLGDDRLVRHGRAQHDFRGGRSHYKRVKDVVYQLLCEFAGEPLDQSDDPASCLANRSYAVGKWFADAHKMGEEKYVGSRVGRSAHRGSERVLFAILVERYPARLPEVYRRLMDDEPGMSHYGYQYAEAVAAAPLPLADKLKVLEYAARHREPEHRWDGISALRRFDPRRANEFLVAALDKVQRYPTQDEVRLAYLVSGDPDPVVWAALARAAKRVDPGTRVELLYAACGRRPDPATRHLQLAFAVSFLADTEVWDTTYGTQHNRAYNGRGFEQGAVRNYAAAVLAQALGLEAYPDRDWTAEDWTCLHALVRLALERDSAGGKVNATGAPRPAARGLNGP
jgi:hypothetical protein